MECLRNLFSSREKRGITVKRAVKALETTRQGPVEEELLPNYKRCDFYAVHIGMVLKRRYKVLAKLGYGASSTVWFCRDMTAKRYVAVKICTGSNPCSPNQSTGREIDAHVRLNELRKTSSHEGVEHIRHADEMFKLTGLGGKQHQCFVYQPACATLSDLYRPKVKVVKDHAWLKEVLRSTVRGLDFLHTEARITHADLKPDNIFFSCPAWTLDLFADRIRQQRPQGRFDSRGKKIVYRSVSFLDLLSEDELCIGNALLGDFGCSEVARGEKDVLRPRTIAIEPFRAPETILQMSWGNAVDIWAFGILTWLCFTRKHLFCDDHAHHDDHQWAMSQHLSQVVSLIGEASPDFMCKHSKKGHWWNLKGEWKNADGAEIQPKCWDEMLASVTMTEEQKKDLVSFMRSMIAFDPEERAAAGRLLEESFLRA